MAIDFGGTDAVLLRADSPVSGVPCTLACWFNADAVGSTGQVLIGVNASGDSSSLSLRVNSSQVQARTANTAGTANSATASAAPSDGVWHHAAAVFAAATSRIAYIDGGNSGSDAANRPVGTIDRLGIGNDAESPSSTNDFNGRIAHVAIWDVALSAIDIAALATGSSPSLIKPQSLVAFYPLVREYIDLRQGRTLSAGGTPTVHASHPRIFMPRPAVPAKFLASGAVPPPAGQHRMFAVF